jgi:hypothetical protein
MSTVRQEVLNVLLAELLRDRGMVAFPEFVTVAPSGSRAMPDVMVIFRGLRLAIEGEIGDSPSVRRQAWEKARHRLDQGIAHIGVAVVYPSTLRDIQDLSHLKSALAQCPLTFAMCNSPKADLPENWPRGNIQYICEALEANLQQLLPENDVESNAQTLRQGVEAIAQAILDIRANVRRIAKPLGIRTRKIKQERDKLRQDRDVARIAGLVLANAMLFQEELARVLDGVRPLREVTSQQDIHGALLRCWEHIIRINYQAIFRIALEILRRLSPDPRLTQALKGAADNVASVAASRVTLQHDLVGRIYHRLLGDIAKPLGTYYTSVPAATLLLRSALDPKRWKKTRWDDPESIKSLRIADLACGTGTLLMAAVEAIKDNFLRKAFGHESSERLRQTLRELLGAILENSLWGLDVLPSAVHLTAATLQLPVPEAGIPGMNLYVVPLGPKGKTVRLGSLDFLRQKRWSGLVPLAPETSGRAVTDADRKTVPVELPSMDLICMNPPFTRSVGGNLLFGQLPEDQRKRCQKELRRLLRETQLSASATAGLGSVFLALADRYLKQGGRLAFVLPKAFLSGIEWKASRRLLAEGYVVETVITSHDPKRWNFSENTDLSEILLVARKRTSRDSESPETTCVNLWDNPDAPLKALAIAERLREPRAPSLGSNDPSLWVAGRKVGEAFTVSWDDLRRRDSWLAPWAFAQWELNQFLQSVLDHKRISNVPLVPLEELGKLGPDVRDVLDGFCVIDQPTDYPAFWGHDAGQVLCLGQSPNAYLHPLTTARPRRPLRDSQALWRQAGRLLVAERLWLNTQRVAAVLMSRKVLSNVWWPVALQSDLDEAAVKALVLWLNSTPGLLILLGHRLETRGAWVKFKKPTLERLPVPDVRHLSSEQREALAATYDRLAQEPLRPFPELAEDPVRCSIDEAVSQALGRPDFTRLRKLLADEPILTLRPLRRELKPAFRTNPE